MALSSHHTADRRVQPIAFLLPAGKTALLPDIRPERDDADLRRAAVRTPPGQRDGNRQRLVQALILGSRSFPRNAPPPSAAGQDVRMLALPLKRQRFVQPAAD